MKNEFVRSFIKFSINITIAGLVVWLFDNLDFNLETYQTILVLTIAMRLYESN